MLFYVLLQGSQICNLIIPEDKNPRVTQNAIIRKSDVSRVKICWLMFFLLFSDAQLFLYTMSCQ